jgi:tetratricopeptide (TPR) repeat protein
MEVMEYLEESIKLGQKALALDPDNYQAHIALGGAYLKKGQYEESFNFLERALKLNPSPADMEKIYIYMGKYFFAVDSMARCISYFEKVTEQKTEHPAPYFILATCYLKKGDYDKAIALYKKIIDINVQYNHVHSALGSVYILMNNYKEAISAFEQNLEINGPNSHDFYALGACYLALESYDKAINYLNEALRISGEANDWIQLALGNAYHSIDCFYPALESYIQSLSTYDDTVLKYYRRAGDLLVINVCKQIISREIKKKFELHSPQVIPYYLLVLVYKHQNKYDKAIEACQKIIESAPSDSLASFLLAELHTAQNSSPQIAIDAYKKVLEQDSQDVETLVKLVNFYLKEQQYDLALIYSQKALEINPNDSMINFQAGLIYLKKELFYTAQPLLEKAAELDPKNHEAFFYLGEVYGALKNYNAARNAWQQTLAMAPDGQLGIDANERLKAIANL